MHLARDFSCTVLRLGIAFYISTQIFICQDDSWNTRMVVEILRALSFNYICVSFNLAIKIAIYAQGYERICDP